MVLQICKSSCRQSEKHDDRWKSLRQYRTQEDHLSEAHVDNLKTREDRSNVLKPYRSQEHHIESYGNNNLEHTKISCISWDILEPTDQPGTIWGLADIDRTSLSSTRPKKIISRKLINQSGAQEDHLKAPGDKLGNHL